MTPDKVEAALGVLRGLRDEMEGLPHSLGYEYTHMAKVNDALSAMEGEAVAWQVRYRMVAAPGGWGQWHEWSLPDRPETINGWDAEYRPLYTAPPPQQAGEVVVTTDDTGRCVMVSRQDDEHRILSVIWEVGATPPQPEAQVSDAMVERGAEFLADIYDPDAYWKDMNAQQRQPWLRKSRGVLNAALTTSGRDGK